jgi:hypothetical protein
VFVLRVRGWAGGHGAGKVGDDVRASPFVTLLRLIGARSASRQPTRLGIARSPLAHAPVGFYITSAYWFTASTSFANPAVTVARSLSDTFAGIAPAGVPAFIVAQLAGMLAAVAVRRFLWPAADKCALPPAPSTTVSPGRP